MAWNTTVGKVHLLHTADGTMVVDTTDGTMVVDTTGGTMVGRGEMIVVGWTLALTSHLRPFSLLHEL